MPNEIHQSILTLENRSRLTLTGVVVIGVFADVQILDSGSPFWDLLQLGLGGYVIGRSAEKITGTYFKNRKR